MKLLFSKAGKYRTGVKTVTVVESADVDKTEYEVEGDRAQVYINAKVAKAPVVAKAEPKPKAEAKTKE